MNPFTTPSPRWPCLSKVHFDRAIRLNGHRLGEGMLCRPVTESWMSWIPAPSSCEANRAEEPCRFITLADRGWKNSFH